MTFFLLWKTKDTLNLFIFHTSNVVLDPTDFPYMNKNRSNAT